MSGRRTRILGAALAVLLLASDAGAQTAVGPETGFPIPRYVSVKAQEARARRGPSFDQRIDWVFTRRGMPLRITAEFDVWRKVEDWEGEGGWIHATLLSGTRTVLVLEDDTLLRARPTLSARTVARLNRQVLARLEGCAEGWCEISVSGLQGWLPEDTIWGASDAPLDP